LFAIVILVGVPCASRADDLTVKPAIKRGAEYIQRHQLPDGSWEGRGHRLGETALAGLALLAAGYPADSPAVAGAVRAVRRLASSNGQTYDVSLAVMFLDCVGHRNDSGMIRDLGRAIVAGQAADGCWTYSLSGVTASGDNSNAQFAVLACWVCRRHGAAMDDAILKADRYFRSTVNRADGGWGYTPGGSSTPTMTCAGLVALAAQRGMSITRIEAASADQRKAPKQQDGPARDLAPAKDDPVVAAALAYITKQMRENRVEAQGKIFAGLYFYWSLERVAVIYGLKTIYDLDWYQWGAKRLLSMQRRDGGWGGQDCVDTAFAILFLSKANVAEDLTNALGGWRHGEPQGQPQPKDTFLRVEKKREAGGEGTKKR
jgi:hypothetical protein